MMPLSELMRLGKCCQQRFAQVSAFAENIPPGLRSLLHSSCQLAQQELQTTAVALADVLYPNDSPDVLRWMSAYPRQSGASSRDKWKEERDMVTSCCR